MHARRTVRGQRSVARPRWAPVTVVAGLLAGLLVATLLPAHPAHAQDSEGYVDTEHGPLGPADRELIIWVRYAGLWEIPAGDMAAERGTDERVREIGTLIADEHRELDQIAVEVAAELQVAIPTEPFSEHQNWLDRIDAAEGEEFDFRFVQLLREAHGAIYPIIAYARSGTQNDLIRDFAETSEDFVRRHMEYLESTGLVSWERIPPAPEPPGTKSRFMASAPGGVHPMLVWVLLGVAVAAGVVTVVRTVRPR